MSQSLDIQVVFDCAEPARLAAFWALALGYVEQPPPAPFATWEAFADHVGIPPEQRDRFRSAVDPEGTRPRLLFQKVPESKTVKNRVHLDIDVAPGLAPGGDERRQVARARATLLIGHGASFLREVDEATGWCLVMGDPEGNEFCLH